MKFLLLTAVLGVACAATKIDDVVVGVEEAQMPFYPGMGGMGMGGMGGYPGMGMMPHANFGQQQFAIDYSQSCSNSCGCQRQCIPWTPCNCRCPPPCPSPPVSPPVGVPPPTTTTTVAPRTCPNGAPVASFPFCCNNGAMNNFCCINGANNRFCCANGASNRYCCLNGADNYFCCENGANNAECLPPTVDVEDPNNPDCPTPDCCRPCQPCNPCMIWWMCQPCQCNNGCQTNAPAKATRRRVAIVSTTTTKLPIKKEEIKIDNLDEVKMDHY